MKAGGVLDSMLAFTGYAAVDLILATGGYARLQQIVRRWPTRRLRTLDPPAVTTVCAALDRAAVWYPRKRLCLARSAVATCLLRLHGIPGQMIIGAKLMPFHAHAWVEVEGQVIGDSPSVRQRYDQMDTW